MIKPIIGTPFDTDDVEGTGVTKMFRVPFDRNKYSVPWRNPLFIGTPGTGKTFLARALAYKACLATRRVVFASAPRMLSELHGAELHGVLERALRRFVRAEFLVIDDFAVLAMDAAQAKLAPSTSCSRKASETRDPDPHRRPHRTGSVLRSAATPSASDHAPRGGKGEEPRPHQRAGPWIPVIPLKMGPYVAGGDR